ncbi:MAG: serine hydrolase [candidate division Zixibacteria bacterium]|nr:serine hydrolase [candidate division Zixibacteria bacterium]
MPLPGWAVNNPALEAKVDAFLKPALDYDLISGTVLIAKNGNILLAKGYGPANREYDFPNTPETKFRLGSMTKQFTAAAIMLLEERGLLKVEDTLTKYYPDYPDGGKITLHHFLTHTSGIPNYNSLPDYDEKLVQPYGIDQVIDWFKSQTLQFEPGSQYAYSNSGYVLLAGIIEKVSGMSYAEFLRQNIFEPLGMAHSGQDVFTTVLKNRATGHGGDGRTVYQAPYRDMPFTSGAGSLYSTVNDLFLWDRALYTDRLLSQASRDKMFTPYKGNYGYGWFIEQRDGRNVISHGGAINGFLANIDRFVDDTVVIITLLNYESTFSRAVNTGLAAIALGKGYKPLLVAETATVPPEVLNAYAGTYRFDFGAEITVSRDDRQLMIADNEGGGVTAAAQSDVLFFLRVRNALIKFLKGDDGTVNGVYWQQGAQGFRGKKIS